MGFSRRRAWIAWAPLLLLLAQGALQAHEYTAPTTVQADAGGCFSLQAVFAAVDGDVMLDSEWVDGSDNTTIESTSTSLACATTVAAGNTISQSYSGCLVDPTQPGTVVVTLMTCRAEVFEVSIGVMPCDTPAIPSVPAYIFADALGDFTCSVTYTITCTGQRLGTVDWIAQSNIEGFGEFHDYLCVEAFDAGLVLTDTFSSSLVDPSQIGVAKIQFLLCGAGALCYEVLVFPPGSDQYLRGDANNDGLVEALPDALYLLNYGFTGGAAPDCWAAADADGNDSLTPLLDTLYLLTWGFGGGNSPPAPFPNCGTPTRFVLPCFDSTCTP